MFPIVKYQLSIRNVVIYFYDYFFQQGRHLPVHPMRLSMGYGTQLQVVIVLQQRMVQV